MTLWANGAGTMTANQLASPDGAVTADKFDNSGDCGTFVAAANGVYTWSLFVKQGTSATASIDMSDGATGDVLTTFTFATKTFSGTTTGGGWTSPSTAYQDYGNGWYRISLTATKGAGSTIGHKILASGSGYTYVWGAQLEAGAYATSYVKTEAAAVTRLADNANKTSISGLIGQTEGTVYWEGTLNSFGSFPQIFDLHTLPDKFMQVYNSVVSGTPRIGVYIQNTTILFNSANLTAISYDTKLKLAFAYKANNYTLYLNGTQVWTNTSIASVPATASFSLGDSGAGASTSVKSVNQALLFKTRLTNAQLAELTTL
jgi:hypothetical protein